LKTIKYKLILQPVPHRFAPPAGRKFMVAKIPCGRSMSLLLPGWFAAHPEWGSTILAMGGLLQQNPTTQPEESSLRPVLIGVFIVAVVVTILVLILRAQQKPPAKAPPYAANLKFSDLRASAAQNFVGATVSYLDGTVTNTGDQTVYHAVIQVTFKDDMGQTAQREELPLRVLRTGGPYEEAVDLNISPLAPGQSKPFRLTFESISAQWNHAYPEMQITDVRTR
jgi:hypothetical protein